MRVDKRINESEHVVGEIKAGKKGVLNGKQDSASIGEKGSAESVSAVSGEIVMEKISNNVEENINKDRIMVEVISAEFIEQESWKVVMDEMRKKMDNLITLQAALRSCWLSQPISMDCIQVMVDSFCNGTRGRPSRGGLPPLTVKGAFGAFRSRSGTWTLLAQTLNLETRTSQYEADRRSGSYTRVLGRRDYRDEGLKTKERERGSPVKEHRQVVFYISEMSPGSSTESYPAFAHIGLRENPGKNLNQISFSLFSNSLVAVVKMVTDQQKAFCVLEYQSTQSIITVQRAFRRQYKGDPPTHQSILLWYRQLKDKGCLCKGKSSGRSGVSAEKVERIREAFARSPQKSTRRASRELDIPHATVWKILRKRLRQKAYRVQMLQHLRPNDLVVRN
ncbi:hypothetical protein ANN_06191 [Periplaneta americana]|uniref:DUF4817 domain-containing protein n=1 Tax=Periplaneta americana TaxID=6978 RepID=A0ABQ8TCY4_PERAM|nr:hypothetical protein ANN_06191 [Periplaneta americana]